MKVIYGPINVDIELGMNYRRGTLQAGQSMHDDGMCVGLSLHWLKRTLSGGHPSVFPTFLEGLLGQNAYVACHDINTCVETGVFPGNVRGLQFVTNLLGFHMEFPARLTDDELTDEVLESVGGRAGFLVLTGGHATALATTEKIVATFDANAGIKLYDTRIRSEIADLRNECYRWLNRYGEGDPDFAVCKLIY